MKNATRQQHLFKFYNECGEKYPASKIVYKCGPAITRAKYLRTLLKGEALTLDLGCGDGYFKPDIKNHVGADIAVGYLKRFKGKRVWTPAQNLPFKNNCFERVFMSEVLEHIWERKMVLDECYRVLTDKGRLIISVPFGREESHAFKIQRHGPLLKKYGVTFRPYLHGYFTLEYTQKLLTESRFQLIFHKKLLHKKTTRYIVVVAEKSVK